MSNQPPSSPQQFHGFGAFLFVIGVVLLILVGVAVFQIGKEYQTVTAGLCVGYGIAAGLCFVASAIIYAKDSSGRS